MIPVRPHGSRRAGRASKTPRNRRGRRRCDNKLPRGAAGETTSFLIAPMATARKLTAGGAAGIGVGETVS